MAKAGTYAALQQLKPIDVSRGTEAIGRGLIEHGERIRKEGEERKKQQALDDKETEQRVEKIITKPYPNASFDAKQQANNVLMFKEIVSAAYEIKNDKTLNNKDKDTILSILGTNQDYLLSTVNDFTTKSNEYKNNPEKISELYPPPIEMYEGIDNGTAKFYVDKKQGVPMVKIGDKDPVSIQSIVVNAMNAKPKLDVTKLENEWSSVIADQIVIDAKKGLTGRGLFNAQKSFDDLDEQTKLELSLDYNRSAWLDKDGNIDRGKLKDKEFTESMIKTAKDEWVNRMSLRAGFAKPTTSGDGGRLTSDESRTVKMETGQRYIDVREGKSGLYYADLVSRDGYGKVENKLPDSKGGGFNGKPLSDLPISIGNSAKGGSKKPLNSFVIENKSTGEKELWLTVAKEKDRKTYNDVTLADDTTERETGIVIDKSQRFEKITKSSPLFHSIANYFRDKKGLSPSATWEYLLSDTRFAPADISVDKLGDYNAQVEGEKIVRKYNENK